MKYLIASDIHGSTDGATSLIKRFNIEIANKIILLGDLYYHGPRNGIPYNYNPTEVSKILNSIKDKLIVVKGNCDSEVDKMISEFDFNDNLVLESSGKSIFLTHGHIYNKDNIPKTQYDAIIYGHLHTGFIVKENDITFANTGSISIPKNNTEKSYIVVEDGIITLKNIEGEVICKSSI